MNRSIGLAALSLVAAWPVAARQQPASQVPPVFNAGTNVVEVDVVVHDKSGRFVPDLKADDFEVSEDGKPQPIGFFYRVGNRTPEADASPDPGTAAAPFAPTASAPQPTPRTFVVFFDDNHLSPAGFKRVQSAALGLFEKEFKPGDIGGVLANGKMANNRLTGDRRELIKAVRDAKFSGLQKSFVLAEREWPRMSEIAAVRIQLDQDQAVLDEVIRRACADEQPLCRFADVAVKGKAEQLAAEMRATSNFTIEILTGLFNGLQRMPGRKSVLLMSEGFLAEESWPLVQRAVGLAARANARVYTLDARGLDTPGMSAHLAGPDPGQPAPLSDLLDQLDQGADAMNSLAVDTGGFVVRNTNHLDAIVNRIVDDASRYYVLAYRPEAEPDGKFHKISVKVKRPGVTFRGRRGYIATPRPASTTTAPGATAPADAPSAPAAAELEPDAPTPAPSAPGEPSPVTTPVGPAAPLAITSSMVANPVPGASTMRLRPDASKHVEALGGDAPDAAASAGWSAYQRGDVESARRSLGVAAASPSARPWVHYALGQASYALRQYKESVDEWEKVRNSAPGFEPVYFDLVDGYIQLHEPDQAIRVLHAAKGRWTQDAEVENALGVVQVGGGALDDALQSFTHAVALAPEESTGYFNLAKTLELRYLRARRFLQRLRRRVDNKADRESAIANYKRYLELGGPLEESARESLARLGGANPQGK
jgi:VWFA-related protein